MPAIYLAVIGDLIASREIQARAQAQERLHAVLDAVNTRFSHALAAQFVITLGDEFQGLLLPGAPVFEILDVIESQLHPFPCRFGVGLGEMLTTINPLMSIGADGPAFWAARDAITTVHNNDDYGNTRTRIEGLNAQDLPLVNNVLALTDNLKRSFTPLQQETFGQLLEQKIYSEQFDQKEAAQKMGITPEAFYRRLKISNIKLYLKSRDQLNQWLAQQSMSEADR